MADLDPGTALFVGGFVGALFALAAALAYVAAPAQAPVVGLAAALAGLGAFFFLLGAVVAALVRLFGG
ncbi:MAG: hypothetical protein ABEJ28_02025 [Salinigranum sp.]